jgi:hypothetical protein
MGTLLEVLGTFMTEFPSVLLRIRKVSEKNRENQNTHFMYNHFFPENCALYVLVWKNMAEPERTKVTGHNM